MMRALQVITICISRHTPSDTGNNDDEKDNEKQLKAHRIIRRELGIIRRNPDAQVSPNLNRVCGMCADTAGVLCYRHRIERQKLLLQRIGQGWGECSHFSKLVFGVLDNKWYRTTSTKSKEKYIMSALKIIRFEAIRLQCKPSKIAVKGWTRRARHYKTFQPKSKLEKQEIGPLEEFYTTYEQQMLGDFPVYISSNKRRKLHIPSRVNDELKWLSRGKEHKTITRARNLEKRCEKAYFIKAGWGYIGSKYVYKDMSELIGRKTFITDPQNKGCLRILKCTGVDVSNNTSRAIFQDKVIKRFLTSNDLAHLGYSQINPE